MKRIILLMFAVCIMAAPVMATAPGGYDLVFEDQFDGPSLDTANWSIGLRDDVSGDITPGGAGTYLLGDQYDAYITAEDTYLSGGSLVLRNQKRNYTGTDPVGSFQYTTGWVNSMHKVYFNEGYVEMRAQFPSGDKVWPAIWMIAEDLVWGPEWDLFEYFGDMWTEGQDVMNMSLMTGTWRRPNWYNTRIRPYDATYDCEAWHVYGFEWTADYARWFIDGDLVAHLDEIGNRWPDEDMYLVLNNSTQTAAPDDTTTWPNYLTIDYVEIYELGTGPDTYPPYPDPATFSVDPFSVGDSLVSMTATVVMDPSSPVEYLFTETSGNPGGASSGWQTSTSYTDTDLDASTLYTYTVTARDALGNTGTASSPASATTNEAGNLPVFNHSFEYVNGQPAMTKEFPADSVDYWTLASNGDYGIEDPSTDGEYCLAIGGVNSVYQTLQHTIAEGDYTLLFDAFYLWSTGTWDCTFVGRLYYQDGGSRVTIGTIQDTFSAGMPDWAWHYNYTVTTTITAGHPAIGKQLGIELDVVSQAGVTFGFDNVRATTGDPVIPECGDATCDPGEDQCNCAADCGTPPATETNCTDGIDEDCDTYTDCDDSDCDTDPACQGPSTVFFDGFESGDFVVGGWINDSAAVHEQAVLNGTYGVKFQRQASIEKPMSTVGLTGLIVEYDRKTVNYDPEDYFYVEWYDGTSWTELEATQEAMWSHKSFVLPAAADNNPDFSLRFRAEANKPTDKVFLDNVEILN